MSTRASVMFHAYWSITLLFRFLCNGTKSGHKNCISIHRRMFYCQYQVFRPQSILTAHCSTKTHLWNVLSTVSFRNEFKKCFENDSRSLSILNINKSELRQFLHKYLNRIDFYFFTDSYKESDSLYRLQGQM